MRLPMMPAAFWVPSCAPCGFPAPRERAGGVVDVRFPPVMVPAGWHCGGVKENETTAPGGVAALDDERRYQAAVSKDPRFDGVFFIGVTSTGIYCRPSCPAITPKRANMRFYRSAAAAQEAGFRACKDRKSVV